MKNETKKSIFDMTAQEAWTEFVKQFCEKAGIEPKSDRYNQLMKGEFNVSK